MMSIEQDREAAVAIGDYAEILSDYGRSIVRSGAVDGGELVQLAASIRLAAYRAGMERACEIMRAEVEANAQARVDRADDALAFEFRGLGEVIAAAIRKELDNA